MNNAATNALKNNEFISAITPTKCLRSYGSKLIGKNRNDNKPLSLITFTKYLCNHAKGRISKYNEDSKQSSKHFPCRFQQTFGPMQNRSLHNKKQLE